MTQPTRVKAVKEVMVLRIGFNPTRSISQCYNTTRACNIQSDTNNTYTKMILSTVKWAQWDKTQSRELLVLFICVCSSLCTIVAHNTAQNRPDNFLSYLPDNHHCSDIWWKGGGVKRVEHPAYTPPLLGGIWHTFTCTFTQANVIDE